MSYVDSNEPETTINPNDAEELWWGRKSRPQRRSVAGPDRRTQAVLDRVMGETAPTEEEEHKEIHLEGGLTPRAYGDAQSRDPRALAMKYGRR